MIASVKKSPGVATHRRDDPDLLGRCIGQSATESHIDLTQIVDDPLDARDVLSNDA